jgi:serine/threonine protein kinase
LANGTHVPTGRCR